MLKRSRVRCVWISSVGQVAWGRPAVVVVVVVVMILQGASLLDSDHAPMIFGQTRARSSDTRRRTSEHIRATPLVVLKSVGRPTVNANQRRRSRACLLACLLGERLACLSSKIKKKKTFKLLLRALVRDLAVGLPPERAPSIARPFSLSPSPSLLFHSLTAHWSAAAQHKQ